MTKVGLRVTDIGDAFTWNDFRDFVANLPPTQDSAFYRAKHPNSWWWTPDLDFLGAVITAVQWGNWQRGGGKGDKPRQIARPKEKPRSRAKFDPKSADELAEKRKLLKQRIEKGGPDGD